MSAPCPSDNMTSVADSSLGADNCSRPGENHLDVPKATYASNTAAPSASQTDGATWRWDVVCSDTVDTELCHYQTTECSGDAHVIFTDTVTTEDHGDSIQCRYDDPEVSAVPETTEIVCDYVSVCDDNISNLDAMFPVTCDEDHSKLLDNEAHSDGCSYVIVNEICTTWDENSSVTPAIRHSNSTMKSSGPCASDQPSSVVPPVSAVAAVYIASMLTSECSLPSVKGVHKPTAAICVLPPQFSPKLPEISPTPVPPIFYICTDENLQKDLTELCLSDKQNTVQKSELANSTPRFTERCDSQLSTFSEKQDICRICHCEGDVTNKLISPCLCSGSLKYIHLCCLQKWIKSSDKKSCELCNFDYIMTMKIRRFKQWERLDMTVAERRKIVCSVTFHVIAITCVIWSLYVLIDRTTEEVSAGTLDWPFWTKLIVVAIGFTGGLVFMYVQCKMYLQLCLRWRQFNKLIYIENAPEDALLRAEAAARIKARSSESGGVVNTVALHQVDSF